jgi:E-phenylitaconyl-CoA hydratase
MGRGAGQGSAAGPEEMNLTVLFEVDGAVAIVTLNRPEAYNSIDAQMRVDLAACWTRIRTDDAIRAVVLTGAGPKAFCTGSDLKNTNPPDESYAVAAYGQAERDGSVVDLMALDKPIICAINGYALAGGLEIALYCDIRIAAEHASFGLTEVAIGSIPGAGGTQRLPRIVGLTAAMQMLLTGERIPSAEALRIGLVGKVVPADQLMIEARAMAEKIAGNAPLAVRAVKRLVYRGADITLEAGIEAERMAWGILRNTQDRIEGRKAFQEKRKPVFRGK